MHSPVAVRLVEAGILVERRHPIEAERNVGAGADELDRVDDAGLQARQDLCRGVVCGVAPSRR